MDAGMDGAFRPGGLEIRPEMLSLIAELAEFKSAWRAPGWMAQTDRKYAPGAKYALCPP